MIEEIEEYCGNTSCKNCCVGGSIYCDTDKNEVAYESVKEVYDTLKEKGLISTKLKKEENGMNKYIKQFMEDNDLKVGEKFDISFSDTGPYVFDENGFLINSWNEVCSFKVTKLLYGELKVIKIKEKPVLTKDEIDILKAFKLLGYKYIGRYELDYKNNNILIVLTNPKNLTRSNFINKLNKSKTTRIDTERFTSIKVGYTYSIDELIGVEE